MKKLMIAASAALCATVGFSLESANVVGYSTTSLQTGFTAAGAGFVSVGAEGCKLTDIKPAGFQTSNGAVQIQLLNSQGKTTDTYKYYKGGRGAYATEGWYNGTTLITAENNVTFAPGTGLWVYGTDGYTLQTSGEVLTSSTTVQLCTGFRMVGNPYPTGLKLTSIVPAGFQTSNGAIQIQVLNSVGKTTATYKYYKGGRGAYATDGWYDGATRITADNDVTFDPGVALWVYGADGYTLTFTSPLAAE